MKKDRLSDRQVGWDPMVGDLVVCREEWDSHRRSGITGVILGFDLYRAQFGKINSSGVGRPTPLAEVLWADGEISWIDGSRLQILDETVKKTSIDGII
tara:strand:+ start:4063 stop:4356 length:294 start_codon:yes stop_codon:yes gene_type:complete